MVTDQPVRRLKIIIKTQKTMVIAAAKAGMDEKTARKYLKNGHLPSQSKSEHTWCTQSDSFDQEWEEIKDEYSQYISIPDQCERSQFLIILLYVPSFFISDRTLSKLSLTFDKLRFLEKTIYAGVD